MYVHCLDPSLKNITVKMCKNWGNFNIDWVYIKELLVYNFSI